MRKEKQKEDKGGWEKRKVKEDKGKGERNVWLRKNNNNKSKWLDTCPSCKEFYKIKRANFTPLF